MGVSHLKAHSARAASAKAPSGSPDAANFPAGKAVTYGTKVAPSVGPVSSYSKAALKANGAGAQQTGKGGVRAGAKLGQPKVGQRVGGVLNKVFVQKNGGRAR